MRQQGTLSTIHTWRGYTTAVPRRVMQAVLRVVADRWLGRAAFVMVMQAADVSYFDDAAAGR